MEIVGLSGYARSGKDEAAKVLGEFGFIRVAFADKLREMLYQLDPIVALIEYKNEDESVPVPWTLSQPYETVQSVIDKYGWDGYKETVYGTEIRRLLQRLGTEAGRQTLWDSIWIDAAFAGLPEDAKVVVTDCRFPNEGEEVTKRGGQIWRISRAGVGPANQHPSETSMDNWPWDLEIKNDGTLEEFQQTIRSMYELGI